MNNTYNNYETNNYSAEQIMNMITQTAIISKENTANTSVILKRLEADEMLIAGLSNSVNDIKGSVTDISDRVTQLELNEEITTGQCKIINASVKRRIREILGNDDFEYAKYSRTFFSSIYSDAKKDCVMGHVLSSTPKRDYQKCIDYIEAWIPSCGITALKESIDQKAKAKRKAKEQGYDC